MAVDLVAEDVGPGVPGDLHYLPERVRAHKRAGGVVRVAQADEPGTRDGEGAQLFEVGLVPVPGLQMQQVQLRAVALGDGV